MTNERLSDLDLDANLPPAGGAEPTAVRAELLRSERRIVVLDDDPTGTQTVRDAPVLTEWSVGALQWGLTQATPIVFVLTNSRALSESEATAVVGEATRNALTAARRLGGDVQIVSRADSTLRGHFPAETDAITQAFVEHGRRVDAILLVPAFLEAGRVTREGVHYVLSGTDAVPVGQTEFARDATFGYTNSDLRAWVAERSNGRWPAEGVGRLTARQLRENTVQELAAHFPTGGWPVVADALTGSDLDVLARTVQVAERMGRQVLVRCGPSFLRAMTGADASLPLSTAELRAATDRRCAPSGLVVAGSHTSVTTHQLERLLATSPPMPVIELDAGTAGTSGVGSEEVDRAVRLLVNALRHGDAVLQTSRDLVAADDRAESLVIAARVASAMRAVVHRTIREVTPRWIVAKGGITSTDIARETLSSGRGWVLGHMLAGLIPVWVGDQPLGRRPEDHARPLCVIFPGNVGDQDALSNVVDRLREASADCQGSQDPPLPPRIKATT